MENSKMHPDYFRRIMVNLAPFNQIYKENLSELEHLSILVHMIKLVQHECEIREEMKDPTFTELETALKNISEQLHEILENNRQMRSPFQLEFQQMCYNFQADVSLIDRSILPEMEDKSRPSGYIAPLLQRTSKRISTKLLKAMTKGTKYRDVKSMSTGQRASRRRHILFIGVAWSLAMLGTILTIGFLTRDFIEAQTNLAIQVDRSAESAMRLPAITICPDFDDIPLFVDFPTERYPGLPLFTISMYLRGNRSVKLPSRRIMYPDTRPQLADSPVENVIVAGNSSSCQDNGFDVQRELAATVTKANMNSFASMSNTGGTCSHCFRIAVKQPEVLQPIDGTTTAALFNPAVQIAVAKPRLYSACRSNQMQRIPTISMAIGREIFKHAAALEERGILDFNGEDYSVLVDTVMARKMFASHYIDFYCNVYFFSGFFYPVVNAGNISYLYNGVHPEYWERLGSGPYFSAYTWGTNSDLINGPNMETLKRDSFSLNGIRMFVEDAETVDMTKAVKPNTGFAIVDRFTGSTVFTFKKMIVDGRVEYRVKESLRRTNEDKLSLVDVFCVGLDFDLFEVERLYNYSTMTLSEFVTDIFEYIGLFTGICIFTLIVAPANRKPKSGDEEKS